MPTSRAPLRSVVIVGGGSAGWMAAAALAKSFGRQLEVTLVESEEIGIIGVGESTVPHLRDFNSLLQIPEADFIRQTKGTFKLGIQFVDWGHPGQSYIHAFGMTGGRPELRPTHQYWLRMKAEGADVPDFDHFSLSATAAYGNRFRHPRDGRADPQHRALLDARRRVVQCRRRRCGA